MPLINVHSRPIGTSIGIVALSAVIMSGCSAGGDEAEFADATETASDLEPVDPELLTVPAEDDLGKIVTSEAVDSGDEGRIVVPSGELTVSQIASVEKVPETVITNSVAPEDAAPSDDAGMPEGPSASASTTEAGSGEDLGPAEGKQLSLVSMGYTSNDTGQNPAYSSGDDTLSTDELASPTLAVDKDGQSRELPKLDEDGQRTYLMSLPAEGKAEIVVTQDGHEQRLDLTTGKRLADDVASTYYREKTEPVEISEPLTFPDTTVKVGGGDTNEYERKVELTTELAEAGLTPWTKEKGWAEDGTAWLVIDGKAGIEPEASLTPSKAKITYSLASGGEEKADFAVAAEGYSDKFSEVVSVPVETEKLEVTGSAKINLKDSSLDIQGDNPRTVKTKQPYAIDFGPAYSAPGESTDDDSSSAPTETAQPEN